MEQDPKVLQETPVLLVGVDHRDHQVKAAHQGKMEMTDKREGKVDRVE